MSLERCFTNRVALWHYGLVDGAKRSGCAREGLTSWYIRRLPLFRSKEDSTLVFTKAGRCPCFELDRSYVR